MTVPHDGMMFSTIYNDNDNITTANCALLFAGGWWFSSCSMWTPTTASPMWFSLADSTFYSIKKVHMMVKLQ